MPLARRLSLLVVAVSLVALPGTAQAASAQSDAGVIGPVQPGVYDGNLADEPLARGASGTAPPEGRAPAAREPLATDGSGSAGAPGDSADSEATAPIVNFQGLQMTSGAPPDPTGEIGPNHFVEAINATRFQIFSRSGTSLAGPTNMSTLWTPVNHPLCATNNDGDPIVMYDQLHDRWLLAQFAFADPSLGPWAMCIAISQTGNPVSGGWFAYEFPMTALPDYEKFGIWRDALYMTTFEGSVNGAFAFNYNAMLAGAPATAIKRTAPLPPQPRGSRLLPGDIDGDALNPTGAPNVMVQTVDGELTSTAGDVDRIEVFEFRTDFATPANSTFAEVAELATAPFDNSMCYGTATPPAFRNCIPQSGSANLLDPLAHRPMWRASYRNFGSHESLVFNQTVDATGTDIAGIRWYELRKSGGGPWTIFGQGTFSPDSTHRWMGSAAINRVGEIGVGYSVSSSSIFPGLRYTGRTPSDPAGQLGTEQVLVNGAEAENTGFNRWGDYSQMSVDPLDDCTFWYVGEYGNRRSQIGSFQISDCVPDTTVAAPAALTNDNTPTFTVGGDEPNLAFECSVDGAAFTSCPAAFTPGPLSDGSHTVQARAVAKGSTDPTPASATVNIDTKKPGAKLPKNGKLKNGKLSLTIKCIGDDDCDGELKLKKGKKSPDIDISGGGKAKVKVPVKPSVDAGDKLKLTLDLADQAGNTATIKGKVKVK